MTASSHYRSIFTQFLEYTQQKNLQNGRTLHAHIIKTGSSHCSFIANTLVNFYAKCHRLPEAHLAFEGIEHKDVVSWNSLINGYSQLGGVQNSVIVMHLFKKMMGQEHLVLPDTRTLAGVFSAASCLGGSFGGKQVHTVAVKLGRCGDVFVGSSLLNVYCKAGLVEDARMVFDEMPKRNSISWATMISGYSMQRICGEALELFKKLVAHEEEYVNEFAVTSVLSAFMWSDAILR